MIFSKTFIWRKCRERKILATHRRVAQICKDLIARYREHPEHFDFKVKKDFGTDKIIWQYWAQGYDDLPNVVRTCLESVDKYASDYSIVRLTDDNLSEYLDLPEFVQQKRHVFSRAFFSDLLRLMLLKTYGGIWMDATIFLSGTIPQEYTQYDFFVFRRDPEDPDYKYWRNTYAYYFGWAEGFRVNMLSSFMAAKKEGRTISELCDLMLLWWRDYSYLPDYFFLMILFDVYDGKKDFPLVSDTPPHYLQQSINDPYFSIMHQEDILRQFPIHKLTYKSTHSPSVFTK